MKSPIAITLALVVVLIGGGQDSPFDVESAYHEDAAIRFVPSQQIDWASMAPEELRALPLPSRDPATIARFGSRIDMFGGVEVKVAVPTPDPLAGRNSYFAGSDGLGRMEIDSVLAVTRLDFDPRGTRLEGRQSWGEVYGSADVSMAGGGFVLRSDRPLSFRVMPADFTADDIFLGGDAAQRSAVGGYQGRGTAFWEIATQYRFSVEPLDDEWLFVQWQPDREMFETGCQYRYHLFRLMGEGPARQVAWTAYGCDV